MLLKLFKGNHSLVVILIPLVAIVLWIPALFDTPIKLVFATIGNTSLAYNWVYELMSFHPKASVILALLLIVLQAFMILRLNFKYIFIEIKTFLPSVLFVIFASVISYYQILHPLLIANLFVLLAIDKAFLFDKTIKQYDRYFKSGFFLGVGLFFYPNAFVLIVFIWLTLIILRTFNWSEWFASLLGLLTPFLFYLAILFLTDKLDSFNLLVGNLLNNPVKNIDFSYFSMISIGFLTIILIGSLFIGANAVSLKKISTRKYFNLFFLYIVYLVALFFLHPSMGFELAVTLAFPMSVVCSVFFIEIRNKWVGEVIFGLTLLSAFVIIWFQ
jgi:hypothetical protein